MRSLALLAVLIPAGPGLAADPDAHWSLRPRTRPAVPEVHNPKAEVKGASKETTDGKTVYEVTLKQDGKNIDVTLTPGGKITLIEKEVAFKDLPRPVAETLNKKYPNAKYSIIEEVIKVEGTKETLEYYEAHLTTADKKAIEAEVLPDGKLKGETEVKEEKKDEKKKDK